MKAQYKHVRRKKNRLNWIPIIILAAAAILLSVALFIYLTDSPVPASASAEYVAEEVAQEKPILAVHEMGEGPAIPFLPRDQPQPKISVPQSTFNFGTIGPQDVVEKVFFIRNEGEGPLTISRAYTTCGCTTAEISSSVIPPGKVATVKLVFDAGFHDTAGQTVRRGLIIENNDTGRPQAEIWVQATVRRN